MSLCISTFVFSDSYLHITFVILLFRNHFLVQDLCAQFHQVLHVPPPEIQTCTCTNNTKLIKRELLIGCVYMHFKIFSFTVKFSSFDCKITVNKKFSITVR